MDQFKEFQGKDLDECITEACEYFGVPREKLELEIIQDAKSGIFGIVGARKAKVRARRAHLPDAMRGILDAPEAGAKKARPPEISHTPKTANRAKSESLIATSPPQPPAAVGATQAKSRADQATDSKKEALPTNDSRQRPERSENPKRKPAPEAGANFPVESQDDDLETAAENLKIIPPEDLDAGRLDAMTREIVGALIRPVAGREVSMTVEPAHGRVRVTVDWEGDAGLLIGREGQTLAALQYLASRILSRAMNAILRVQLDIGDYRARQDEKLRGLARFLADRARRSGKSFSTRPLSSYHRRIIHLYLQEDPDVQTRSSGEGPLKRVVISPKKSA